MTSTSTTSTTNTTELLRIELQDGELMAVLSRAIVQLARPHEMMDAIGAQLEASAQLRFETKTDPAGLAWPALAPATIARYKRLYPKGTPGSLLERTRQLRSSLGHVAGDSWVDIGTSRASAGGKWQIGQLHEWGTRAMPRRGFLVADPESGELAADDRQDILDIVEQAISGAFG